MSTENCSRKIFTEDVEKHLKESYFTTSDGASNSSFDDLLAVLSRPPAYTIVRVNTLQHHRQDIKQQLQEILHKKYELKKQPTPIIEDHPLLADTLVIPSNTSHTNPHESDVSPAPNEVVVDMLCAVAVLRGADIFAPGVMGMTPQGMQVGDTVAIYGDVNGQCRRGYTQKFTGDRIFIGNGQALMSRVQLFVETEKPSGVAIQVTEPVFDCPSLNGILTDRLFLQNLPSIVVGHVLKPVSGELVLDMCAAPGGKTTHIATLMQNTGVLVALDRSSGKVKHIQENAAKLGLDMVRTYAFNSTKACQKDAHLNTDTWEPPYPPGTFDKILLDAPCSGLGQRPQIKNKLKMKDLCSYPPYQRKLFGTAVELLKPGGTLVYSTCTITAEENENLVEWALDTFPQLELNVQTPHLGGPGRSSPGSALTESQLGLLQRFDPVAMVSASQHPDCNVDTIGFFIAKFTKVECR